MDRKTLIKVAELLNLNIKKNWKTEKILGMVDEKLAAMNSTISGDEMPAKPAEQAIFRGYHPITGKAL